MKRKLSEGFTLIELLVVIAIIGLLSSVALVATGPSRAKARDAKRQADIRQIASAMELCYDDKACSGATDNSLQYPAITANTGPTKITGYLDPMPKDPKTGVSYIWSINSPTTGTPVLTKYCVYAELEVPSTKTYIAASEKGINTARTGTMPTTLTSSTSCW